MTGFAAQWAEMPRYLAAHVELSLLALALGLTVSLPLGVLASRRPALGRLVLGVASVLQTIPGLALLALMVPLLAALSTLMTTVGLAGIPSIGFLPAVLALALYSVLPMLRNTVTGLVGVEDGLVTEDFEGWLAPVPHQQCQVRCRAPCRGVALGVLVYDVQHVVHGGQQPLAVPVGPVEVE